MRSWLPLFAILGLALPGCFIVPEPSGGELQPVPGPPPPTTPAPATAAGSSDVEFLPPQPADSAGAMIGADVDQIQPLPESVEPEPAPEPAEPRIYVIEKGDSYWKIAKKIYGDGMRMKDIEDANPDVDPKKLQVGDEILLPD
jgi:5'-nucleotidase